MYDRVIISADALTVNASDNIQKFKDNFVWFLIPLCVVFSIIVFKHIDSPLKYLLITLFVAVIIYYKFVYLRFNGQNNKGNNQKLFVSSSKIEYYNGMHSYLIPIVGIASIEDRSRYHDFQGRNERGWNHTFVIKLRDNCSVLRISASQEKQLTKKDTPEIQVFNLVLKHSDYEKVLNYILRILQ